MNKLIIAVVAALFICPCGHCQTAPADWKTWFISSGKTYPLPAPASVKTEVAEVVARQQALDSAAWQSVLYWNAGAPGYRWQDLMAKLWIADTSYNGMLANMLLSVATYDATIAAWDTKYTYNRPRPFLADGRVKALVAKPETPSYPCEHSVAAGVAATIIGHFYPAKKDSVYQLAQKAMDSRIAAGVAYPSDTRAGFALGQRIAEAEIEATKAYVPQSTWDGKMPEGPGVWKGKKPMYPMAGKNKTVVLDSSSQYRPGPPPDPAKEMAELKAHKPTFRSMANAFFYGSQPFWEELLHKKIFEYNLHLDPPRAARLYAIAAVTMYDGFAACWDAKYTYWGIRPDQYDTTFRPVLFGSPPFPGYPSGHAAISGAMGELYSYFFPAERAYFEKKAKEAAESRFQGGIHFRSDNDVALELGRKVASAVIRKVAHDGTSGAAWAQQTKDASPLNQ